eukprot:TRINITY_DN1027_c0_g1_i4.p1 TRINITY_DN1027_c0_g1~~TRINITY_DN1027_c0_g1_i4.p1  ORF type:complete len:120 (-),score=20.04 TRINITY_DN1027_c0_g1_i4:62-421(-)
MMKKLLSKWLNWTSPKIESTNKEGETALHIAIKHKFLKIVELLLAKGADIEAKDESGNTPLHKAAQVAYVPIINFLIDKGASLEAENDDEETPLKVAKLDIAKDAIRAKLVAKGLPDRL